MTTCYIIRHADKAKGDYYNPLLHHNDLPISEKGVEESRKLASFFAEKRIAAIYISAYQRTGQTIQYVAEQQRLTPLVDERLNEIDNGLIDVMSDEEIQKTYPDTWKAFMERNADFRFPEGETGEEAQRRIVEILEEKRQQHASEAFIFVCHDGLMRLLMCHIAGIPVYKRWTFQVDTCGIMEITFQSRFNAWKLARFNQVCY